MLTPLPAAGDLDRRVTIQQRDTGRDVIGQPVNTWVTVAMLWANRRFASGLETIKAGAETSIVQASYRVRYTTGLDAGMRLEDGSELWDIQAVLPDRAAGRIDLVCKRVS